MLFSKRNEANNFYRALNLNDLKKFNLEIAEDKTKIIPFGKYAVRKLQKKRKVNLKHLIFLALPITVVKVNMVNFE